MEEWADCKVGVLVIAVGRWGGTDAKRGGNRGDLL